MIERTGPEYYTAIAYTPREEDAKNCAKCNGAGYVRRAELVPGQIGFGAFMFCPNWNGEQRRCVTHDHMGFER